LRSIRGSGVELDASESPVAPLATDEYKLNFVNCFIACVALMLYFV
jgi:hypothetical protein